MRPEGEVLQRQPSEVRFPTLSTAGVRQHAAIMERQHSARPAEAAVSRVLGRKLIAFHLPPP